MWITEYIYIEKSTLLYYKKEDWYQKILDVHKTYKYDKSASFLLGDDFKEMTKPLIRDFIKLLKNTYFKKHGHIENVKDSNFKCFAYVGNNLDYRTSIHSHPNTSTITGVFYFSVPCRNSGGITFYQNRDCKFLTYFPEENDFLVFPNFLLHMPEPTFSESYRISINIEYLCEDA